MNEATKIFKDISSKVNGKSKYLIYQHLILSIIVAFLDLILYGLIARINNTNSFIYFLNSSPLTIICFSIIFISFARLILLYSTSITTAHIGKCLHTNLLYSYLKIPYIDFLKKEKGFYINKLSKHVELGVFALFSWFQILISLLTIICAAIYILFNADINTIILIIFSGFLFLIISFWAKKELIKVSNNHKNNLNKLMLSNVFFISSFREIFFSQNLKKEIDMEQNLIRRTYLNGNLIAFYSGFSRFILEPIILIIALFVLSGGNILQGSLNNPAIIFSLLRASGMFSILFSAWTNYIAYKSFAFSVCEDINSDFYQNKEPILLKDLELKYADKNYSGIECRNICYRYNNENIIFNNLNFKFKPGINLITGKNGSGKSTLLDIISGLIRPDSGEVFINNVPIWKNSNLEKNEIENKKIVLSKLSYISQNQYIRNNSILKNITNYNNLENCDLKLLKNIIEILDLKELVGNQLNDINKFCGENGDSLSSGQRQKISLARSIYKKPKYLFLDEALSNIDQKTKLDFLGKIESFIFIKYILIVSHDFLDISDSFNKCILNSNQIRSTN